MREESFKMLDPAVKKEIDEMSYEQLLRRWLLADSDDTIFQGDSGAYYADVMFKKREEVGQKEHVRLHKFITRGGDGG
jgi:hypothetical protein